MMDFSTPYGRLSLTMLGRLAQFYSDNLSQETKKGWHQRRMQGLYCGSLPFGAIKGDNGIPIPDMREREASIDGQEVTIRNFEGVKMAFELAAQGESDREIVRALNAAGYRTTGTYGSRPFSRDTVRDMLTNRFYIGFISDGNGGWIKAKHEPLISQEIWSQAQEMRQRNTTSTHKHCNDKRKACSLTGITYCWCCKGRIHVGYNEHGIPRLLCHNRTKGWECSQKSARLDGYEEQINEYLKTFHIPEDYQKRILEDHYKLQSAYADNSREKARLEARIQRIKELYKWGDITKEEYAKEKAQIQKELKALTPAENITQCLEKLAKFLANVAHAWEEATQEQRNKLARCLFREIWLKDKQVIAVKPQPEFEPFFKLNYEEFVNKILKIRPRGGLKSQIPSTNVTAQVVRFTYRVHSSRFRGWELRNR
jgi:hypothetical protein